MLLTHWLQQFVAIQTVPHAHFSYPKAPERKWLGLRNVSRLLAFSDCADKDRTIVVRWGKPHWFNLDCKWVFTSDSYWRLAKYFPCAVEREVGLCIWPGSGFTCPDIQRVEHRADSVWKRLAQKTSCRHLLLGQGLCGIMGHSQTCAGFFFSFLYEHLFSTSHRKRWCLERNALLWPLEGFKVVGIALQTLTCWCVIAIWSTSKEVSTCGCL